MLCEVKVKVPAEEILEATEVSPIRGYGEVTATRAANITSCSQQLPILFKFFARRRATKIRPHHYFAPFSLPVLTRSTQAVATRTLWCS
jgi:hypothetical protein